MQIQSVQIDLPHLDQCRQICEAIHSFVPRFLSRAMTGSSRMSTGSADTGPGRSVHSRVSDLQPPTRDPSAALNPRRPLFNLPNVIALPPCTFTSTSKSRELTVHRSRVPLHYACCRTLSAF